LKLDKDKIMTANNGILIQGIAWLLFWLGPAFSLFEADPRWGHNFAIPLTFITVGLAYHLRKLSCQMAAVFAAFLLIPTLLALWPWYIATLIAAAFLGIVIVLYLIEKGRKTELINPGPRLRAWLIIHLMTFAYIGLAHMALTFYLVRWSNPGPFTDYLPVEHEVSTSTFNAMLFVLIPLAIMERFVKKLGGFDIPKVGFLWAMLMIIIPLLSINTLGQ
jgi:hypothetical protein